ncbi:MAG: hypothetical protein IOC54_18445 [Methylobacterium sp.]|jgi:hypothetical protein|nr:hypothetical protein [Methylobacterium sp.]
MSRGNDRPNAGHAHEPTAFGILVADLLDFARDRHDPFFQPHPVVKEAEKYVVHSR